MAFTQDQWNAMLQLRLENPKLSIRKLKDKIHDELGINVSTKSLHNRLFQDIHLPKPHKDPETIHDEIIIGWSQEGNNQYNKKKLREHIDEFYIQGYTKHQIAEMLNISPDTVANYLFRPASKDTSLTKSQQLKQIRELTTRQKATKLIEKIVDDRIDDYENNREFERELIEAKKSELKILTERINEASQNDKITSDQLKDLNHLVNQINKLTSNYTKETVSMLKELGFTESNNAGIVNNNTVNSAEQMIVIDEALKSVLEDDDDGDDDG